MRTIDLASEQASREQIFELAERQNLLVRTIGGKLFIVAEVGEEATDDDFAEEIALTRKNQPLRELLAERSREPGVYSLDQVREKLGLSPGSD